MNIPEFTAQASLYKSSNRYRSSGLKCDKGSGESIMPAYYPGPAAQAACNQCTKSALADYFECIATEGFPVSLIHCTLKAWWDAGSCIVDDCCPKRCGPPDIFDLAGSGCCDADETCVSKNDLNSRHGCCPSDQSVCAGKCCPKGHTCCGDTCCPPTHFCRDGFCSELPAPSLWPDDWEPPKPPARSTNYCRMGFEPCGGTCCAPGLECCPIGGGQVACMTNCLH